MTGVAVARIALCLTLLVPAALLGGPAAAGDTDEPVLARVFEVRHRPLADAAELVGTLLSEDGKVSLQPRLKTLVVEDRASVLDRVESLLESFDLPPRNIELTLTLFMGTDRSREEAGRLAVPPFVSDEVVEAMEKIRVLMKWNSYEVLGSRSVNGIEGGKVSATLSDDYRVVFEVDSVNESQRKVRFRSFSVQKIIRTADGTVRHQDIYTADMVSPLGRLYLVGAASAPEADKALFLTLRTELR